jgi:hypothetical protein
MASTSINSRLIVKGITLWFIATAYSFIVTYPFGNDTYWLIDVGYRVTYGEVPYRDFWFAYSPGMAWIAGIYYLLADYSPFWHQLFNCSLQGLTPLAAYILFKRLRKSEVISLFIAFLFAVGFNTMSYKFWIPLSSVLLVIAVIELSKNFSSRNIYLTTSILIVTFFLRHDYFMVQLFLIAGLLIYLSWTNSRKSSKTFKKISCRSLTILFLPIIISASLLALYLYSVNALTPFYHSMTTRLMEFLAGMRTPFSFPSLHLASFLKNPVGEMIAFYYLLVPIFYSYALLQGWRLNKNSDSPEGMAIIFSVLYGFLIYPKAWYMPSILNANMTFFVVFIITGLLLGNHKPSLNITPKSIQTTWIIFSLWYVICRVGFEVNSYRDYGIKLGHEPLPVLSKISKILGPNPISLLDTTHLPIIYPLTSTRSPFYYPWFMPAFTMYPEDKQELLRIFKEEGIQYVIWSDSKLWHNPEEKKHFKHFLFREGWPNTNYNFEDMVPEVAKYIRKYYRWVGSDGAFQVLKYNEGKPVQLEHFYTASGKDLVLVDPNDPTKIIKPEQIALDTQTVSFYNSQNFYFYTTETLNLEPGRYELEIDLAYKIESNSEGVEIMLGNWESGKVLFGTNLLIKSDLTKVNSHKYNFTVNTKNDYEVRVTNLGNTSIYLNKVSLKVLK